MRKIITSKETNLNINVINGDTIFFEMYPVLLTLLVGWLIFFNSFVIFGFKIDFSHYDSIDDHTLMMIISMLHTHSLTHNHINISLAHGNKLKIMIAVMILLTIFFFSFIWYNVLDLEA